MNMRLLCQKISWLKHTRLFRTPRHHCSICASDNEITLPKARPRHVTKGFIVSVCHSYKKYTAYVMWQRRGEPEGSTLPMCKRSFAKEEMLGHLQLGTNVDRAKMAIVSFLDDHQARDSRWCACYVQTLDTTIRTVPPSVFPLTITDVASANNSLVPCYTIITPLNSRSQNWKTKFDRAGGN